MTSIRLPDGPMISQRLQAALAQAAVPAAVDPNDPANFPPRDVQIPRDGWRNTLGITGLVVGGAGLATAGVSLIRQLTSGGMARVSMPMMIAAGATALVGGAVFGGSRLIGPKTESALAAGIPTEAQAKLVDQKVPGKTDIVECADGTFAILRDNSPTYSGGGGSSSGGSGGGSRSNGGGSRPAPAPNYPTGGGGSTSRGDDSGSSRNSTSNGNPSSDDF